KDTQAGAEEELRKAQRLSRIAAIRRSIEAARAEGTLLSEAEVFDRLHARFAAKVGHDQA
ncbi:MAG: hypothetical protein ACOYOH_13190, partial [Paracraurococcus sp.]